MEHPFKLVYVEWLDSETGPQGWRSVHELEPDLIPCKSVGFITKETDISITLFPHLAQVDTAEFDGAGDMTIPKASIVKQVDINIK